MGKIFSGKNRPLKLVLNGTILLVGLIVILALIKIQTSKPKSQTQVVSPVATSSTKVVVKKPPQIPKLSLESIFATESAKLSDLDQSKIVGLIATGDVIPARGVNWLAATKVGFNFAWEKTADFLKKADLTLINLEAPIFAGCPVIMTGFTFCGTDNHIQGMTLAGVDVASLANNHIGNFGSDGTNKTIKLLTDNGIEYSGFDHLGIKEVKGVKLGFLAFNGIGVTLPKDEMATEIAESKKKVDVLIVSVHWGKEYESLPLTDGNIAPDNPVEIGHLMIDSGADLIIGNHPHWVQGVELYKDKLITYAHGNFIFDQTWSEETKEGVVGEYTFYDKKLIQVHYRPTKFDNQYQPRFLTQSEGAHILKRMQAASIQLAKQ